MDDLLLLLWVQISMLLAVIMILWEQEKCIVKLPAITNQIVHIAINTEIMRKQDVLVVEKLDLRFMTKHGQM